MHGAPYVDAALAKQQGRIGRSWGCPALREAIARDVIDTVRGGGVIFSYYPDKDWLTSSRFLNCDRPATKDTEAVATKETQDHQEDFAIYTGALERAPYVGASLQGCRHFEMSR